MKQIFLIIFFFCFSFLLGQNVNKYKLLDVYENSDFNYIGIDSINHSSSGIKVMLDSVFNVIKGDFTVYRFITYDRGIIFGDYHSEMNNLMIIKVNKKNMIVDGYQFFLQTPEMPFTCHLYRITRKSKVKDKILISKLKFRKVHTEIKGFEICNDVPNYLEESGSLIFGNASK